MERWSDGGRNIFWGWCACLLVWFFFFFFFLCPSVVVEGMRGWLCGCTYRDVTDKDLRLVVHGWRRYRPVVDSLGRTDMFIVIGVSTKARLPLPEAAVIGVATPSFGLSIHAHVKCRHAQSRNSAFQARHPIPEFMPPPNRVLSNTHTRVQTITPKNSLIKQNSTPPVTNHHVPALSHQKSH